MFAHLQGYSNQQGQVQVLLCQTAEPVDHHRFYVAEAGAIDHHDAQGANQLGRQPMENWAQKSLQVEQGSSTPRARCRFCFATQQSR